MNTLYCVTLPGVEFAVVCRAGNYTGLAWRTPVEAWRILTDVLTWETQDGAQKFADMNGGTVTPLAEIFDQSVILPPIESQPTDPE